ncbi:MAG: twin-arginine translocase TatA/TatE family subunit [Candidatus Acidiferrales bacterium]
MEALTPMHLLIIAAVIVIMFGGKKIPEVMKGLGEGVRSFKEGMRGDTPPGTVTPPSTTTPAIAPPPTPTEERK